MEEQQTPLQQTANEFADKFSKRMGVAAYAGYVAGADWQRNHVWHNASEEPEHEREILLLCVDGTTVKGFYEGDYFDTAIDIIDYGEKWAYLSDLLPKSD